MKLTPEQRAQKLVPVMREIRLRAYPPKAEPWLPLVIGNKPRPLDVFAMRVNAQAVIEEFDFLRAEVERLRALAATKCSTCDELFAACKTLLASASPHPVEHPAMTKAWAVGLAAVEKAQGGK